MTPSSQPSSDPAGPPTAPLSVVSVTRREVGGRARTVSCTRELLTPGSPLPDRDSRADVVVVAYHPGLSAEERVAITGPLESTTRAGKVVWPLVGFAVLTAVLVASFVAADAGWVPTWSVVALLFAGGIGYMVFVVSIGGRTMRNAWPAWSRAVLAAHARVDPDDVAGRRSEVTGPTKTLWGGAEGERARRCWDYLVVVATVPRPVEDTHPAPAANRWHHSDGTVWQTPTELTGRQLSQGDYTHTTRRFVELADSLRSGQVPERSPEHVQGFKEVFELAVRTGEVQSRRVDWAPVIFP